MEKGDIKVKVSGGFVIYEPGENGEDQERLLGDDRDEERKRRS